jgi:hypothetical protein
MITSVVRICLMPTSIPRWREEGKGCAIWLVQRSRRVVECGMRRPRFQFRLSTLLWITLAVACWFGGRRGGMAEQRRIDDRKYAGAAFTVTVDDIVNGRADEAIEAQRKAALSPRTVP